MKPYLGVWIFLCYTGIFFPQAPLPLMMQGDGLVRPDDVAAFGERPCARGTMGRLIGLQVMPEIINLLGLSKLIGIEDLRRGGWLGDKGRVWQVSCNVRCSICF